MALTKEERLANLARGRAEAKARKMAEKQASQELTTEIEQVTSEHDFQIRQMWIGAYLAAFQSMQVRHVSHMPQCVVFANEAVKHFQEKFN